MKLRALMLTTVAVATMLAGCDRIKGLVGCKPSGQVVATVGGKEITALELRSEMAGFGSRDPEIMKQAQQQALQQIIMRRLVAQKAEEDKLDKSSDYVLQKSRADETLLAQLYQRKLAAAITVPSRQEAEAYVAANPGAFANRRILSINQVIVGPNKVAPERFRPLASLEEVRALFDAEGVPYQENVSMIDTLSADPRMVQQITALPPGEVFVIPQQGALVFNRIKETSSVPFTGELAIRYAGNVLRQRRAQEAVGNRMQQIRKDGEKEIVYNESYKPKPAKPAAKGAAPAPKAQ